ncbi:DinB family protein [Flavobacterium alkalisoli]|uniref:DinB family protein n=1 Tax=Flavobacterium alkalisoli TaxID=2602769 RepID=A0A5B9FSE2_9FLAO|nr:DinB family protein [Flavobacterium alkalisoli]QEE49835.1 DinB family protein [Flavobacterium alkalisoli]
MKTEDLIRELVELTYKNINEIQAFKELSIDELSRKQNNNSWSVLECIEHLNRYGDFYIPEIRSRIEKSKHKKSDNFKTGLLGDYFAKILLPKEKLNKMKTFSSMNPINSSLDKSVLDKFIYQQQQILKLLETSADTDLTKVKTSISISRFIKLRLGDTFRVVIYHNLRHVIQAKNVLNT